MNYRNFTTLEKNIHNEVINTDKKKKKTLSEWTRTTKLILE